jgi:phosphate transport system permease protein
MEEESHRMGSETLGKKQVVLPTTDDDVARSLAKRPRIAETIIEAGLFLAGAVSILTTLGIVYILVRDALDFFLLPEVTLIEFLTGTTWLPQIGNFGVWPLLLSTLIISFIAMLVGVPVRFFHRHLL